MQIVVADTTASGGETARLLLDGVSSPVRLRELIRHRVREEVARYNARPVRWFGGLVQPASSELAQNGYVLPRPRALACACQSSAAVAAFERNGFFVFAGDRQVDDLDEELTLDETDVVSFVKLVPLAGG